MEMSHPINGPVRTKVAGHPPKRYESNYIHELLWLSIIIYHQINFLWNWFGVKHVDRGLCLLRKKVWFLHIPLFNSVKYISYLVCGPRIGLTTSTLVASPFWIIFSGYFTFVCWPEETSKFISFTEKNCIFFTGTWHKEEIDENM
jgi:hypothetical protein